MRSIYETPAPPKAPREGQAIGALTGKKDAPPTADSQVSVRHVPNAGSR